MNIAICDDEKKLRCDLRNLIEIHLDLKGLAYQIEEYESGAALMERDKTGPVDILFLDIEMPALGGMETAKALRAAGKTMLIIFVTAYPDYVFQGYEVQAFHYILKPYQETKIKEVLDNALKQLNINQGNTFLNMRNFGGLLNFYGVPHAKTDFWGLGCGLSGRAHTEKLLYIPGKLMVVAAVGPAKEQGNRGFGYSKFLGNAALAGSAGFNELCEAFAHSCYEIAVILQRHRQDLLL